MNVHAHHLALRCYAEKDGDQWQAFCVDLTLAAQGDTLEQARVRLNEQISEYVHDALIGEDRPHARDLLPRPAPLRERVRYLAYSSLHRLGMMPAGNREVFIELLPIVPAETTLPAA
jgi:predicted RNase H-like HicB family nuclease